MYTEKKNKTKHKGKGNPNPKIENLRPMAKIAPEGSSAQPVQVRVPAGQRELWMTLPSEQRNTYLRKAIADLLKKEGLL